MVPTLIPAQKSIDRPPAILSLIGDTPLVEVTRIDTGPCHLFLKLENQNPTGSIKDRVALAMVEAAERDGQLGPGGTIIEATAGNTGLGLALVAAAKGYRIILIIPDKMSQEKIAHVRALGAEVRLTRSDVTRGHPEYYQDVAARLASEIPGGFYVNQFGNPANPLAHERSTGPEIWEQMRHDVDTIVVGVGSGGTLTGLGRFFNRVKPRRGVEMVLADPTGSVLYEWVKTGKLVEAGSWAVEGIGEDFIPDNADMSFVTEAFEIDESDVLVKVHRDASHFNYQVKQAMTDQLETLPSSAKIDDLFGVFDRGRVAIVMDGDQFLGLITRSDLLSYLRRHMPKSPVEREFS